jgi:hypothetical protein
MSCSTSPVNETRPWSSTTTSRTSLCATLRFCSTSRIVATSAARPSASTTWREAFRRLVDQQDAVVGVEQRARERDHLLLAAGERPGLLRRALLQLGEQLVDQVVAVLGAGALGEGEVLPDGQAGEDVTVLGDVGDAAADDLVHRKSARLLAVEHDGAGARHEAEDSAQRRRLADAVAPEQTGDPAAPHAERDALQDVRLAEIDVQVAHVE